MSNKGLPLQLVRLRPVPRGVPPGCAVSDSGLYVPTRRQTANSMGTALSRRACLRGLVAAGALAAAAPLALGVGGCACDRSDEDLLKLIAAYFLHLAISGALFYLGTVIEGEVALSNPAPDPVEGTLEMAVVDSSDGTIIDSGRTDPYRIPGGWQATFRWTGLEAKQTGKSAIFSQSAVDEIQSASFDVVH